MDSVGFSLIESVDGGQHSEEIDDGPARIFPQTTSVVESCLNQINYRNLQMVSRRVLLRGPEKSGKSSLAMDLALSLALSEPCRCNSLGRDLLSYSAEKRETICRNCTAVTLIMPGVVDRVFPIPCESIKDESCYSGGDTTLQFHNLCEVSEPKTSKKQFVQSASWVCTALKRINIQHVSSLRDIYRYLLTVTSLPIENQPFGGIIMDDIECLCSSNDLVDSTIQMSKIVATLIQSITTLYRIHNFHHHNRCEPFALVTTSAENSVLKPLSVFWSPVILDLQQINDDNNYALERLKSIEDFSKRHTNNVLQTYVDMTNGWTICSTTEDSRRHKSNRVVDFAVVRGIDQSSLIRWIERLVS